MIKSGEGTFPTYALAFNLPLLGIVHFLLLLFRLGNVLLNVPRHPTLNRRAGIGFLDDPDGNTEGQMQFLAEIIGDNRGLGGGFRIARFPFAEQIALFFQRLMPVFAAGLVNSIVGQVDVGFHFRLVGIARGPAHVGLPSAEPDFADGDILNLDGFRADDFQRKAGAIGRRIQQDFPSASRIGLGRSRGSPRSLHGDFLTWIGPAPDSVCHLLLQNHVIAKKSWQAEAGLDRDNSG